MKQERIKKMKQKDLIRAHEFSANNKPALQEDDRCGCFYCGRIFEPAVIEEFHFADNPIDNLGTAVCPYCGIDSVIGESSGYPIDNEFLEAMNQYWF